MTIAKNNKIYISFAILFFLFGFIFSANAQSTSKTKDDLTLKLQQKILLTQKQVEQINTLLSDYFKNPTNEEQKSIESKLESLLDSRQKMKYSIIKKEWWDSVVKEIPKKEN